MKSFRYSSLKSTGDIRLMMLLPGPRGTPIHCRLVHAAFDANPEYQALSYTWGDPNNGMDTIYVNGRIIQVVRNLYNALQCLRYEEEDMGPRCLWIDSLCINQTDTRERSLQVQLMGQIYKQAHEVLIWLGTESSNSDIAMRLIEEISLLSRHQVANPKDITESHDDFLEAWTALQNLCHREYWSRTWIIQEIELARHLHVYCGDRLVSWNALQKTLEFCQEYMPHDLKSFLVVGDVLNSPAARLVEGRRVHQTYGMPLKTLLYTHHNSRCTEPRDSIYGLLGLASDCQNGQLVADYTKSTTQIYHDVMDLYKPFLGFGRRDDVRLSQFLIDLLKVPLAISKAMVQVKAQKFGIIHIIGISCGSILQSSSIPLQKVNADSQMLLKDCQHVRSITDDVSRISRGREPNSVELKAWTEAKRRLDATNIVIKSWTGTKQVALSNGQIALVPKEARKGDKICQFLSCDVAVILRKDHEQAWQLVGNALVFKSDNERFRPQDDLSRSCLYSIPESDPLTFADNNNPKTFYIQLSTFTLQFLTTRCDAASPEWKR